MNSSGELEQHDANAEDSSLISHSTIDEPSEVADRGPPTYEDERIQIPDDEGVICD